MAYERTTWQPGQAGGTLITATRLNNIEAGIVANDSAVAAVADTVDTGRLSETQLSDTFVAFHSVDLESFLLPGETMPNDGVADAQPLLQRAVDAVAAAVATVGPQMIRMPPGKFRLNSSVTWAAGVQVVGAGRANTRVLPYGTAVFGQMTSGTYAGTLDDVIFMDMTIDCINQTSATDAVGVKGVALRYLNHARFERVRIVDAWATGFGCDFLQDTAFIDCTAIRCGRGVTPGSWSFGAGFGVGTGDYERETVTFQNCVAIDNQTGGFFIERILTLDQTCEGRGFLIDGCVASGNYVGINEFGGHGTIISNSQITDNVFAGISFSNSTVNGRTGGKDALVQGNTIIGNGTGGEAGCAGITLRGAGEGGSRFIGNTISHNTGPGVYAPSTAQLGPDWTFGNNTIEGNSQGGIIIDASLLTRWRIESNTIRNNVTLDFITGDGIRLAGDVIEPVIVGNTVQGHLGAGLNLPGADRCLTDAIITRNRLTECSSGGMVNAKYTNDDTHITDNIVGDAFTTITNYSTNPSFENNIAGAAAVTNIGSPARANVGADNAVAGVQVARATVTADGSATLRIFRDTIAATLAGKTWTSSAYVRIDKAAILRPVAITYWNSSASQRSYNQGGIRSTGELQRVAVTVPMLSNGSQLDFDIAVDIAKAGMPLDADGVLLTEGNALWPYFDGTFPNCAWTGTAHTSTSVYTIPTS